MLGQVLALRLRRQGKEVTLLEAAPDLGGLAVTWSVAGVTFDKFYHVILPFDDLLLSLLNELGLSDEVVWKKTRTGFFSDGRLVPLNGALDYLKLNAVGMMGKVRLALLLMVAARRRNGEPLEKVAVKDWLVKWCGQSCYDRIWRPLLRAKLGDNASLASAGFIWASIRRLYLARKGANKVEMLGYVRKGGYGRILRALRQKLEESGVEVCTNTPIRRIFKSDTGLCVETSAGTRQFENVVSTLSASASLKVCEGLGPDETARLASVVYQGIICASVILNRPLAGNYLTYLTDSELPFTAIVEMTSLTGTEAIGGRTLVYLPRYVTQDDDYWDLGDDEISKRFLSGLRRVHPDVTEADVAGFKCARVREVMAVPTIGYRDRVPPIVTAVPGLYLVNSAQIIDGTLNVNATLGVMENALPHLIADRGSRKDRLST
jgi:protoporphyrinogen oxidase